MMQVGFGSVAVVTGFILLLGCFIEQETTGLDGLNGQNISSTDDASFSRLEVVKDDVELNRQNVPPTDDVSISKPEAVKDDMELNRQNVSPTDDVSLSKPEAVDEKTMAFIDGEIEFWGATLTFDKANFNWMIQNITPDGQFHKKQIKENWKIIGIDGVYITKENFAWSFETITHQEESVLIFGISLFEHEEKIAFVDGEIESWGATLTFDKANSNWIIQNITPDGQFYKKQIKENWKIIAVDGVYITKENFAWSFEAIPHQEECDLIFGIPY